MVFAWTPAMSRSSRAARAVGAAPITRVAGPPVRVGERAHHRCLAGPGERLTVSTPLPLEAIARTAAAWSSFSVGCALASDGVDACRW